MSESENIDPDLEALLDFLKQKRNFDVTGYKRASLGRRVDRRMQEVAIERYAEYLDYLEVHPAEFAALFDTILINVTGFFRDPAAWTYIAEEMIPAILASKSEGDPIRVWSAGCASGEEAYTIAIVLAEALGPESFRDRVKIYATDLDDDALNTARLAFYTPKQVAGVPAELLEKYFEQVDKGYTFRKELRRSVIFGRHDLIQNAPISRIDLLVCRNVLMYFNVQTQARILAGFHYALNEKGYLFLGRAEMLFMHARAFAPVELKKRVFMRTPRLGIRDRWDPLESTCRHASLSIL